MLLAFDTATPAVTVALHDGDRVRAEHTVIDARRHGELLAPGIAHVLRDARVSAGDVSKIAVGVGPGPFTGLRVGLVTARAMGDALGIPVVGVCTLDVLAAAVVCEGPFLVATDARRREVYWATYDETGRRVDGPHVDRPAAVDWRGPAFGAGALLYRDEFPAAHEPRLPAAATLCELVATARATLLDPQPLYLRRPDAVEPGPRKAVTPA
ncbi:MAG TPA: tRNA (adenosine(37)-N6)-threonylcarbamoyltransferase complex dimerization subunit type 1 TsaB [Acidothermaceae bacterium]